MNTEEKLEKIKELADAMYYAAQHLTTDASRLHKAMDEYHKFIIHEYKEEPKDKCKGCNNVKGCITCVDGSEWAHYEEPVSEDLEKAAFDNAQKNYKEGFRGAAMQAFNEGASWQKEQMMAKAVDVTVHVDAGGYQYIPQIELFDYDNDVPLAKEGDKYKVILIKENKGE